MNCTACTVYTDIARVVGPYVFQLHSSIADFASFFWYVAFAAWLALLGIRINTDGARAINIPEVVFHTAMAGLIFRVMAETGRGPNEGIAAWFGVIYGIFAGWSLDALTIAGLLLPQNIPSTQETMGGLGLVFEMSATVLGAVEAVIWRTVEAVWNATVGSSTVGGGAMALLRLADSIFSAIMGAFIIFLLLIPLILLLVNVAIAMAEAALVVAAFFVISPALVPMLFFPATRSIGLIPVRFLVNAGLQTFFICFGLGLIFQPLRLSLDRYLASLQSNATSVINVPFFSAFVIAVIGYGAVSAARTWATALSGANDSGAAAQAMGRAAAGAATAGVAAAGVLLMAASSVPRRAGELLSGIGQRAGGVGGMALRAAGAVGKAVGTAGTRAGAAAASRTGPTRSLVQARDAALAAKAQAAGPDSAAEDKYRGRAVSSSIRLARNPRPASPPPPPPPTDKEPT